MAKNNIEKLKTLAKRSGCESNPLFLTALDQYIVQQRIIDQIRKALDDADGLMTTKEYVKGRENVYANPLVKELPKHSDSANKTAELLLKIIAATGTQRQGEDSFETFVTERDEM